MYTKGKKACNYTQHLNYISIVWFHKLSEAKCHTHTCTEVTFRLLTAINRPRHVLTTAAVWVCKNLKTKFLAFFLQTTLNYTCVFQQQRKFQNVRIKNQQTLHTQPRTYIEVYVQYTQLTLHSCNKRLKQRTCATLPRSR